ncbi:SIMPL domain-containing protein [Candidatus Woesearchaeota archaeon]|nr:SIMPL domain-containing protein [Candidatus Woesearchaeota archaeon]
MEKSNSTLMVVFIAGIILIAVILVLNQGQTKIITGGEQQNAISVSGNANLQVEPDQAEVYVTIETSDEKAENAKNENAAISGNVIKSLKKEGIKDEDIETTSFYISPRYKWDYERQEQVLTGYTATNTLKVTTKDVDNAGKVIDTAVDSGANSIQSVNFGLSKEMQKEVFGEALIMASKVARDKAESLANSLGVNLGKVVSVQESNFNFAAYDVPRAAFGMEESKAATQIVPGKVEVSAFVSVAYEIK